MNINDLTPEQLKALRAQLRDEGKKRSGDVKSRWAVVDPLLQEKDESGEWKHTTADIMAALQAAKVAPAELSDENRKWWLKVIQTRKQDMDKAHPGEYGFRPTVSFGLTQDRVLSWASGLTADERKALVAAIKAL